MATRTNDRLPGAGRNSFIGPDYATTDARLTRRLYVHDRLKLDLVVESFNLLNRDNKRVLITETAWRAIPAYFVKISTSWESNTIGATFRFRATLWPTHQRYAPRQLQLALKMIF